MEKKISRNDPCWCNSGKKYKKCHLNREEASRLTRRDLELHQKGTMSMQKCSVKDVFKDCAGNIIKAHTVSKSGSLRKIAVNGHVIGARPNLSELIKSKGSITLSEVGINRASTFTGFCAHHDKTLFAPLEDREIILDDEQLFLLAYRSIARELFAKEANTKTADLLKEADRGMNEFFQVMMQKLASDYAGGVDLALKELKDAKASMDKMLVSKSFSKMRHFVIELATVPQVLVSSTTQPEFDFDGQRLQDLNNVNAEMSHIIFNAIAYEDRGSFIFSWLEEHDEICRRFTDTLAKRGKESMGNALVQYCYSYAENTWASPKWWESAPSVVKEDISERLHHGANVPHTGSQLLQNSINYKAFAVAKFGFR